MKIKNIDKVIKFNVKRFYNTKKLATCYFRFNTIFAVKELNFCVRDGNRCILFAIVTNLNIEKIIL